MSDILTLYPVMTPEREEKLGYMASELELVYDENYEQFPLVLSEKSGNNALLMFDGIAEKEMLMYKAVIEMVQENYDINSIKVSDITSRAGIGKGTAYEYFGSKEEIIVKALFYDTYVHILNVEKLMKSDKKFKEKYYLLMDYPRLF